MKSKNSLVILLMALTLPPATLLLARQAGAGRNGPLPRPEGPCDMLRRRRHAVRGGAQHDAGAMIYIDGVRGGTMYDIYGQCDTLLNQRSHYNYANIMNSTYPRNRPILGGFAYSLDSAPSYPLH